MLQRFFGLKRRESEHPIPEEDFVVVGEEAGEQPYTLEGATAFEGQSSRAPSAVTVRSFSCDDPLADVPFRVNIAMSDELPEFNLSEAIAVVTRMEATDWDEYQYNFKLEQSIMDEFNSN